MPEKSELHVVVPGICGPLADTRSLQNNPVIKKWLSVLSRTRYSTRESGSLRHAELTDSRAISTEAENAGTVIASIVKLELESDFPAAALTMMANHLYDESKYYMFADPVHLRADLDHAVLTSCLDLDITEEESATLIEILNNHFAQDDFEFILLNKNQWLVSSNNKIQMKTTPLVDAVGRNINFILPQGEDARYWKKMLTEAQMLLHSHEINVSRENSNRQTINSLWFHGAGMLQGYDENTEFHLCSNSDEIKGLSEYLNCNYQKLPESVSQYISNNTPQLSATKNKTLSVLHLTELEHLVNYTDVEPWLDKLSEILESWIYPLLKYAHKNNIELTLYPCKKRQYHFSKLDYLKFWVATDKVEKHVSQY